MVAAQKPLIIDGLPLESQVRAPFTDRYGPVDLKSAAFWADARWPGRFREISKRFGCFIVECAVIVGEKASLADIFEMGAGHSEKAKIEIDLVKGGF